jgi:hypothetical protein
MPQQVQDQASVQQQSTANHITQLNSDIFTPAFSPSLSQRGIQLAAFLRIAFSAFVSTNIHTE